MLTGESLPVFKNESADDNLVYQGTTITSGLAICRVTEIGNKTKLGLIGKSLENIKEEETPLQRQIKNFVKKMAIAGIIIFLIVWGINYFQSHNILDSLLKSLTLAMSILPGRNSCGIYHFYGFRCLAPDENGYCCKTNKDG